MTKDRGEGLMVIFKSMADYFGNNPGEIYCSLWLKEMTPFTVSEIREMSEAQIKSKIPGKFPSIDSCIAFVESVAERNRNERMAADKKEEKRSAKHFDPRDDQTRAWKKNINEFASSKITINQYLDTAIKTQQMDKAFYEKEKTRYILHGKDLSKPITRTGLF